jgi:membrane-associated protease RseP (regulator of RpoE activity)
MTALRGPLPADLTWVIDPVGMAAWFGLFMTGLNLLPIGQLDGGHVVYAWLDQKARLVSLGASWGCLALVYFGPNWLVWSLLLRLLGRGHPRTLDDREGLGSGRKIVAVIGAIVFIVCFVPDPLQWSWKDFFESVRLLIGR